MVVTFTIDTTVNTDEHDVCISRVTCPANVVFKATFATDLLECHFKNHLKPSTSNLKCLDTTNVRVIPFEKMLNGRKKFSH